MQICVIQQKKQMKDCPRASTPKEYFNFKIKYSR